MSFIQSVLSLCTPVCPHNYVQWIPKCVTNHSYRDNLIFFRGLVIHCNQNCMPVTSQSFIQSMWTAHLSLGSVTDGLEGSVCIIFHYLCLIPCTARNKASFHRSHSHAVLDLQLLSSPASLCLKLRYRREASATCQDADTAFPARGESDQEHLGTLKVWDILDAQTSQPSRKAQCSTPQNSATNFCLCAISIVEFKGESQSVSAVIWRRDEVLLFFLHSTCYFIKDTARRKWGCYK